MDILDNPRKTIYNENVTNGTLSRDSRKTGKHGSRKAWKGEAFVLLRHNYTIMKNSKKYFHAKFGVSYLINRYQQRSNAFMKAYLSAAHCRQLLTAGIIALLYIIGLSFGAVALLNTPPGPVQDEAAVEDEVEAKVETKVEANNQAVAKAATEAKNETETEAKTSNQAAPEAGAVAGLGDARFSAKRAMTLIEEFARNPRPLGTPENARVERLLVKALEDAGYEVFVQKQPVVREGLVFLARNIYARLEGTDSTGAIALCAHYDSVPYGPGAADDAAGVAAIIMTAELLKNSAPSHPLRNDIIFLLTDGEENGLLGPQAFLEHNPWRDDLSLVINFEARGYYGPSMMYLTWPGNEFFIRNFIEGAAHPVASSVMFDFADALPTASDYYVFKREGYPGFDLAFVGGLKYYHTANDKPENLNIRSLQHHGSYAVSLARHFGQVDFNDMHSNTDERIIYFNTIGHRMAWYEERWVWPFSIIAIILIFTALITGFLGRRISFRGLWEGAIAFLVPWAATPLLAVIPLYWGLIRFGPYALYNQNWYFAGYCLLLLAVFSFSYAVASRLVPAGTLAMSVLLLMLPVMILNNIFLPMGSFIFTWPLMGAALALLIFFLLPGSDMPWQRLIIGAAGSFPALVLLPPLIVTLTETFTFLMGPPIFLFAGIIPGLSVLLLTLAGQAPRLGFGLPLAASLLAVASFFVAVFNTGFSPERPKMNYLLYAANYTEGTALYATREEETDEWTEQFFSEYDQRGYIHDFVPFEQNQFRLAEAPLAHIKPGKINAVEDAVVNGVRHLALHIKTGYETAEFFLWTDAETPVRSVSFNDIPWHHSDGQPGPEWYGHIRGRFDEGVMIRFALDDADRPFTLTMVEQSYGLPKTIPAIRPRPDWMIPMSNTYPTAWDFSFKRFFSDDPLSVLTFESGSRSKHHYIRQDFNF